jgi:hypothetical protein
MNERENELNTDLCHIFRAIESLSQAVIFQDVNVHRASMTLDAIGGLVKLGSKLYEQMRKEMIEKE